MRTNYYHYTSGVFPRKFCQQINRLLFRITKSNGIIQILDFDQTQLKSKKKIYKIIKKRSRRSKKSKSRTNW